MGTVTRQSLAEYLSTTLHQPVEIARWRGAGVPTFLTKRYQLLTGKIGQWSCLFAVDQAGGTPSEVARQMSLLRDVHDGIVIYVAPGLSADRRARLIAAGVAFVVPGNQLYVPELAVDLREHFRARPQPHGDKLSPVAQVVLFHHLLKGGSAQPFTPTRLARDLLYTTMSLGRAFDELNAFELAQIDRQGRTKQLVFDASGMELIKKAQPFLRSPVHTLRYVRKQGRWFRPIPLAGLSALAKQTNLAPPNVETLAIHKHDWRGVSGDTELKEVAETDEADYCLELWHYEPKVLGDERMVDPLSLYAQYWNDPDERVSAAAENVLAEIEWSLA